MKTLKGKAIYHPNGKAGEYAKYACNFYVGCSNGCTYCYCKKGVLSRACQDMPQLKKCFRDEAHALEVFEKELKANLPELQKHGLFFSFTTDPMLPETMPLTEESFCICRYWDVPVKILTKRADWVDEYLLDLDRYYLYSGAKGELAELPKIAFGFTLTGNDELEPNASTNAERIEAMRKLHEAGFKTWASLEPIIDTASTMDMFQNIISFCDLFKIGLESRKKYDKESLVWLLDSISISCSLSNKKAYFKDSLLLQAGINRCSLPKCCVGRDYNMFLTDK
jgi:DNA repair photolyase